MPMASAEQRGARAAAVQEPSPQDVASSCSICGVELSVDEAAGSVSVALHLRLPAGQQAGVHPRRVSEGDEAAVSLLERAEEGRTAEASCQGRERQCHEDLAHAREAVRAGVVALLERAACLEGVPDNEPEVRGVLPLPLPLHN